IDVRPFAPMLAPYLFLGEVLLDAQRSHVGLPARLQGRDYLAAVIGLNRIAGSGLAIVDAFFERRKSLDRFVRDVQQVAGSYLASFLVPLLAVKDAIAQGIPEERIARDIRGHEFIGPVVRMIPFLSQRLPERPGLTRATPYVQETPLLSQLTGILRRTPTPVETELSRLGVRFGDIVPPSTGDAEIDRRAAQLVSEELASQLEPRITSRSYKVRDDAQKKDELLRRIAKIRNRASKRALKEFGHRRTKRLERLRGRERVVPI
ncbi:hypothetical protein LCGC14_2691830, partial [marine sediment metagenome]